MKQIQSLAVLIAASMIISSCNKNDNKDYTAPEPLPQSTVVKASGDLTSALTEFRHLLGDNLNTTPGQTGGRREVNWDGVAASLNNNDAFPFDFFNTVDAAAPAGRKRGLVYVNDGTTFRVDSSDFSGIEASYAAQFNPFSGKRTFSGANSNVTQISFQVPGETTPATVNGFGVVFVDVDDANSTSMEFFNGNKSLGVFKVPVAGANSFSFLGVQFPNDKITKVKIIAGNAKLATGVKDLSDGGTKDLVVMDDFFYSEPIK
ncbi:MAG: hypothetical protein ACJ749_13935 [Flavisolibacter sp.]